MPGRACNQTCIGKQWCPLSKLCKEDRDVTYICSEKIDSDGNVVELKKDRVMMLEPDRKPSMQESGVATDEVKHLIGYSVMDLLNESHQTGHQFWIKRWETTKRIGY
jgi:hypothetical protein